MQFHLTQMSTSLAFEDYPFEVESFEGKHCRLCHATNVFMDELVNQETGETLLPMQ